MKRIIIVIAALLILPNLFSQTMTLINKGNIRMQYRNDKDFLYIIITAKTSGWVSVGIDPTYRMKNGDFKIGVVINNQAVVTDHYGTAPTSHQEDSKLGGKNNVSQVSGSFKNGFTEIRFRIPLRPDDPYDATLKKGNHLIVLAYSHSSSLGTKHNFIGMDTLIIR